MASTDPVAIDAAAAKTAGINPNSIKYFHLAVKEGLGNLAFAARGERLEYFRDRYPRKTVMNRLRKRASDVLVLTGMNKKIGL
jgi:uncharacterized protein (DUF362 family)